MSMSQRELFDRLVTLETKKLALAEDIKQLKDNAKYSEDTNPEGVSKEDIKLIGAAAKLEAKRDYRLYC